MQHTHMQLHGSRPLQAENTCARDRGPSRPSRPIVLGCLLISGGTDTGLEALVTAHHGSAEADIIVP